MPFQNNLRVPPMTRERAWIRQDVRQTFRGEPDGYQAQLTRPPAVELRGRWNHDCKTLDLLGFKEGR